MYYNSMAVQGINSRSYWQNKELILTVLVFNLGHKTLKVYDSRSI